MKLRLQRRFEHQMIFLGVPLQKTNTSFLAAFLSSRAFHFNLPTKVNLVGRIFVAIPNAVFFFDEKFWWKKMIN